MLRQGLHASLLTLLHPSLHLPCLQMAINPDDGEVIIIEMNPRVSRSSALASKATGFPIAKFAAKLAVGYTLDQIANDITQKTPASFEPSIDYVVTKIPRFAFEKFPGTKAELTTMMKSVGEHAVMQGKRSVSLYEEGSVVMLSPSAHEVFTGHGAGIPVGWAFQPTTTRV